jgi:class 3 adenylate cyclase/YHS domain-containing protein
MNEAERFPIERLAQFTGETVEQLHEWRERGLLGQPESSEFEPIDVERARILQLAVKRGVPLDVIVRSQSFYNETLERDDHRWFEGRVYSLEEAADALRLDVAALSRRVEAAGIDPTCLSQDDVRMLRGAQMSIDAGFPEEALLQVFRVYADTLSRASEAGQWAFHFYVHHSLLAEGLPQAELSERAENVARYTRGIEPVILYFFRKSQLRTHREDRVLHMAEAAGLVTPSSVPGEIDRAVVFVDLSSFTPMTEAMGDPAAAEVLEQFAKIVRDACTRNLGRVVKQVGDAFLLVFADAPSATECALHIVDGAAREPRFPAARAGVHWGQVLYREGDYVGSNVNLASRVATSAERHQVLLTEAARDHSKTLTDVNFVRLGKQRMKGLPEETVLFEANRESSQRANRLVDPVCGMEMGQDEVAARLTLDGREQSFCSDECLKLYVAAPERYG